MSIYGNMVGGGGFGLGKTLIFEDEIGNQFTGVATESVQIFTADDSKVAAGYTYVSDKGISTGSREFLSYRTTQSCHLVWPGESYSIPLVDYDKWDYTKFQCVIANFNTDINDSTAVDKVVLSDSVFNVNSTTVLATITKNSETKSIDLNIVNNSENTQIIYYTTYKEEEL